MVAELAGVFAGLAEVDPEAFAGPWFLPMTWPSRTGRKEALVDPVGLAGLLDAESSPDRARTGNGATLYLWRTSADDVDIDVAVAIASTSPWTRNRFVLALPPSTVSDLGRCRRLAAVLSQTWPQATIDALNLDRAPIALA